MSAEIIGFPGRTKLDIHPDKVLEGAKGELGTAVVIGYTGGGKIWLSSSTGDKASIVLLIEQIKFKLLNGDYDFE